MRMLDAILSGIVSTLKSWRGILITWLLTLILVSILAISLKSAIKSALGNSMITEKLANGFNTEVFTDLGPALKVIISFFSVGLIFVILIGFFQNVFLTGGLFSSLRKESSGFTTSEFFRSSARNFWSYLIITLIISFILNLIIALIIAVPLLFITLNQSISFNTSAVIVSLSGLVSVIVIPFLLLVVDYARAWQASIDKPACFTALAFGFSMTFKKFLSSYLLMLFILLVQGLFIYLVYCTVPGWRPVSTGGTIVLFLVSQLLFLMRIVLKVWRYGCITALMEQNMDGHF
jgi:hypothetical protein